MIHAFMWLEIVLWLKETLGTYLYTNDLDKTKIAHNLDFTRFNLWVTRLTVSFVSQQEETNLFEYNERLERVRKIIVGQVIEWQAFQFLFSSYFQRYARDKFEKVSSIEFALVLRVWNWRKSELNTPYLQEV